MRATEKTREEFKELLDERKTFHIGYIELERFLSKIFKQDVQIIDCINDSVREASVLDMPKEEDVKEIEMLIRRDNAFEYWRIHQVFEWLVYNGYIDKGYYFVDFWW